MFSRWNFARLKVAENALGAGRIDEAFERLNLPEMKKNRRAQELLDILAKSLTARARLHAQAGRYQAALTDLSKLEDIGRLSSEAQALRERVTQEQRQRAGRHAEKSDAFNQAAHDIRAGRLESGQLAVEHLEDASRREQLKEELDIRVRRSEQLLEQAREMLNKGNMLAACRFWEEACARHGRSQLSDNLAAELAPACQTVLEAAFKDGRLDEMRSMLATMKGLRAFSPALSGYDRLMDLSRQAARKLAEADYVGLREMLLRLQATRGATDWIVSALNPLDEIIAAHSKLLTTPLGLLGMSLHKSNDFGKAAELEKRHNEGVPLKTVYRGNGLTVGEQTWLVLVDGTGSVLLTMRDVIRIGRAGGHNSLEVPIAADIQSHHADIIRDGEDYFLVARGPVRVNHRQISRKLLRHGDRIALGTKAKMVFHKPSAKSATAVLKLSSGYRLPQDVSSVVLFKGTCLIGPQSSCHIRTGEGDSRLVLFERGGELFVRRAARDGRPTGEPEALPAHETHEYGDVRMTVKEYEAEGSGGLA